MQSSNSDRDIVVDGASFAPTVPGDPRVPLPHGRLGMKSQNAMQIAEAKLQKSWREGWRRVRARTRERTPRAPLMGEIPAM